MIVSRVKDLMINKDVSIRKMAEKTGLSDATILRARREQIVQCRLETLQTIADFLECRVKDLFEEVGKG